jgi:hypothetical protein
MSPSKIISYPVASSVYINGSSQNMSPSAATSRFQSIPINNYQNSLQFH